MHSICQYVQEKNLGKNGLIKLITESSKSEKMDYGKFINLQEFGVISQRFYRIEQYIHVTEC
jgi:hypothetical protein